METITIKNSNNILDDIINKSFIKLNDYMDADDVYYYIKNISQSNIDTLNDFLDIIYEKQLTNYILEIEDIKLFNETLLNKVIEISKIILEK